MRDAEDEKRTADVTGFFWAVIDLVENPRRAPTAQSEAFPAMARRDGA